MTKPTEPIAFALTLRPQWAWAVCFLGKDIENRESAARRLVGQRIAIHAGSGWGPSRAKGPWGRQISLQEPCRRAAAGGRLVTLEPHPKTLSVRIEGVAGAWYPGDLPAPFHTIDDPHRPIPVGAVVATAVVDRIAMDRETSASPWSVLGSWHWALREVAVLDEPIPCRGHIALGWALPDDVRDRLASASTTPAWRAQ